jgi:hypothetical protein
MKYLFWLIILIGLNSCSEKKQNISTQKKGDIISLDFFPSFHDDLNIEFEIFSEDSVKMTLKQNPSLFVFDSIAYLGDNTWQDVSYGDYSKATSFVKPNFFIEYTLTKSEFSNYQESLEKIDEISKKQVNSEYDGGLDGMTIYYKHITKGDTLNGHFWSPSIHSEVGKALVNILELLEKNPNRIVEITCEKIKSYLDEKKWMFKIINEAPLIIKVFNTPCCPCQAKIEDIVKTLPKAEQVFVDITHYGFYKNESEDMTCWELCLKKKYKYVRWIMNYEDYNRFEKLIYKK